MKMTFTGILHYIVHCGNYTRCSQIAKTNGTLLGWSLGLLLIPLSVSELVCQHVCLRESAVRSKSIPTVDIPVYADVRGKGPRTHTPHRAVHSGHSFPSGLWLRHALCCHPSIALYPGGLLAARHDSGGSGNGKLVLAMLTKESAIETSYGVFLLCCCEIKKVSYTVMVFAVRQIWRVGGKDVENDLVMIFFSSTKGGRP